MMLCQGDRIIFATVRLKKGDTFQVRTSQTIDGLYRLAPLKNQRFFRKIRRFAPKMFDLMLITVPQIIKAQAIPVLIHNRQQFSLKRFTLCRVKQAFKHRTLYPLTVIDTLLGNLTQALAASSIFSIDVLRNQYQNICPSLP